MTFSDKSRYDGIFHKVTHKGVESTMNYTKRFQNVQDLSVSVGNSYSEGQLMHIFLDNFHRGGNYTAQITSYQVELRIDENFNDQKYLSVSSLQTDYLNLDRSSGSGRNNEKANFVQVKCNFCGRSFPTERDKIKDKKRQGEILRMVIRKDNKLNVHLANILDAYL